MRWVRSAMVSRIGLRAGWRDSGVAGGVGGGGGGGGGLGEGGGGAGGEGGAGGLDRTADMVDEEGAGTDEGIASPDDGQVGLGFGCPVMDGGEQLGVQAP